MSVGDGGLLLLEPYPRLQHLHLLPVQLRWIDQHLLLQDALRRLAIEAIQQILQDQLAEGSGSLRPEIVDDIGVSLEIHERLECVDLMHPVDRGPFPQGQPDVGRGEPRPPLASGEEHSSLLTIRQGWQVHVGNLNGHVRQVDASVRVILGQGRPEARQVARQRESHGKRKRGVDVVHQEVIRIAIKYLDPAGKIALLRDLIELLRGEDVALEEPPTEEGHRSGSDSLLELAPQFQDLTLELGDGLPQDLTVRLVVPDQDRHRDIPVEDHLLGLRQLLEICDLPTKPLAHPLLGLDRIPLVNPYSLADRGQLVPQQPIGVDKMPSILALDDMDDDGGGT